jgi:hypothetical protein
VASGREKEGQALERRDRERENPPFLSLFGVWTVFYLKVRDSSL